MRQQHWNRIFMVLALAAAGALSPQPALAEPQGTPVFTINGTGDTNSSNPALNLREALLLARGGTGAGGLNRALSAGEQSQLSGCNINGGGLITGGCGAGLEDKIVFALAAGSIITLVAELPHIDDTAPTTLDGVGVIPIVDASPLTGNFDGLTIESDDNTVRHLKIQKAPFSNFAIEGSAADNNTLFDVYSWKSESGDGITIDGGDSNFINQAYVGVASANSASCGAGQSNKGNALKGIVIRHGAANNQVKSSYVGCNGNVGIWVTEAGSNNNLIGPNNKIGTNAAETADLGNGSSGIWLNGFLSRNVVGTQIVTNTIANNDNHGVELLVTDDGTQIGGNRIVDNHSSGIRLTTSNHATIGGPSILNSLTGNQISGNQGAGVSISQNSHDNLLAGNKIGTSLNGQAADGNTGNGVDINMDSHDNLVGVAFGAPNIISGGNGSGAGIAGVYIGSGSHDNLVANNYIGTDAGAALALPNQNGVVIEDAYQNTVGTAIAGGSNVIAYNTGVGILLTGSDTHHNIVRNSELSHNGAEGVRLEAGAHDNTIGDPLRQNEFSLNGADGLAIVGSTTATNTVAGNLSQQNGQNGIRLGDGTHHNVLGSPAASNIGAQNDGNGLQIGFGAHDNRVLDGNFNFNDRNGIELTQAGTTHNVISTTSTFLNTLDGINESNAATGNQWSRLSTYDNGGLGIDRDAPTDNGNIVTTPYPIIVGFSVLAGDVTVTGTASAPPNLGSMLVELYQVAADPSGYGEGRTFLGSTTTNGSGGWSITFTGAPGCWTALQTVHTIAGTDASSEFGPTSCRLFLPLVTR